MSVISENPEATKKFMALRNEEDVYAASALLDQFKNRLPELTKNQTAEALSIFAGIFGAVKMQPEALLGLVDGYTVLHNLETIAITAACTVYPEYQK